MDNMLKKSGVMISCNTRNSSSVSICTDSEGITEVSPMEIAEGLH